MNKPCSTCDKSKYNDKSFPNHKDCYGCDKMNKYYDYLKNKRKYRVGERIKDLNELLKQKLVYWSNIENKPINIEVVKSWQFRMVIDDLEKGNFYKAVRKDDK